MNNDFTITASAAAGIASLLSVDENGLSSADRGCLDFFKELLAKGWTKEEVVEGATIGGKRYTRRLLAHA